MSGRPRLLVADNSASYVRSLTNVLESDFDMVSATSAAETLQKLSEPLDLALVDVRFDDSDPDDRTGFELLQAIKARRHELPVVMMTAYADIPLAVESMQIGAVEFIEKQSMTDSRRLRSFLLGVLESNRRTRRSEQLEQDLERIEPWELIGASEAIESIRRTVEMVAADGYATVLLRGETGTGKELVARSIWRVGWRSTAPFVPVALASLSPSLVESEIFGHEKGAFTGAERSRVGYLERADGGVLFLDEIGDLAMELQVKLLRFLESREFQRVGSTDSISVNLQVVAATNRDLEQRIRDREFRDDLYFRLKASQIVIAPLRERGGDVPALADHFLGLLRQQGRTGIERIHPGAMEALRAYTWPGNVRELRSALEWAVMVAARSSDDEILREHLPSDIRAPERAPDAFRGSPSGDLDERLARFQLAQIEEALEACGGRKDEAWRRLGLNDRFALRRRAKRLVEQYPDMVEEFQWVRKLYG